MKRSLSRCAWAATAAAILLLAPLRAAPAGVQTQYRELCKLLAVWDPDRTETSVVAEPAPRHGLVSGLTTATITVNYSAGFDPAARAAFQAAVDIWANQISSPVPIVVDANWSPLGTGVLGSAGSTFVYQNFGAGTASTYYHAALANKLAGRDIDPAASDITATFNSSFTSWYFGTDSLTPTNKYDFESVVLHELGHGLGFSGSGSDDGTNGSYGLGSNKLPMIFDRFVESASKQSLLDTAIFPNPSVALHTLFTSELATDRTTGIFWNGAAGVAAAGGASNRPHLDALSPFASGSNFSHLSESNYPAGDPNSLMTRALTNGEVIHHPGSQVLGIFQDQGWSLGCTYSLSPAIATVGPAGTSGTIALTTQTGCTWTASSSNTSIATITSAASGTGSATISYSVLANSSTSARTVNLTIGGQTFTISQNGTAPTMSLDKTSLIFSGVSNGASFTAKTGTQTVRLTQSGAGTVTWTAASNSPWLVVSPASGSGPATLSISVQFAPGLTAVQNGQIALTFSGAGNTAGPIAITLNTLTSAAAAAPVGSFDSPLDGTTGVAGSIAVAGWAIDDVQVTRLTICRNPVAGENPSGDARCNGQSKIYIGDGVFIDGARDDIRAAFPTLPGNTRAGWGYLMLTNFLPNQGNGTFTLFAYASDADGHTTQLGTKTITCDNNGSIAPFGAIDTPGQGETVSGVYNNFGWVLSPGARRADVPGGGTVRVFIDGTDRGAPVGWVARPDLAALFPVASYSGVGNAAAAFTFDTTTLANGGHTIFWIVTGTTGGTSGVGSRFFSVLNGSLIQDPPQGAAAARPSNVIEARPSLEMPRAAALRLASPRTLASEIDAAPVDRAAVQGRRGFDLDLPLRDYAATGGRLVVQSEELDRVELQLSEGGRHEYTGYLRTSDGVAPLPIGSTLDPATGAFTWMPGVGFIGPYDLVFVRWSAGRAVARQDVRIVLHPQRRNRVGPQVVIDLPSAPGRPAVVGRTFFLGGWAADLDSPVDGGVDTVHVWAYPVDAPDGSGRRGRPDPLFLGAAIYGGGRPDVAEIYGERFANSGYGLTVLGLAPGTYDLAVFAYSTVTGGFVPAKTVRVTVR